MKLKKNTLALLFICLFILNLKSQVATFGLDYLPAVKSGTTYFTMNDPNSEKMKEYKDVINKTWKTSKIEFIKYEDMAKYMAPGNSFFTISFYTETNQMIWKYTDGSTMDGVKAQKKYFHLEFFSINEKFFKEKKNNSEFGLMYKNIISWVDIHSDYATTNKEDSVFLPSFDLYSHFKNWGPGVLKNYIQCMQESFSSGLTIMPYKEITKSSELANLKTETLYVPDYVLIKLNPLNGNESNKNSEKDIFEDYKLKYKLITNEELNKKILTETKPFYYVEYVRSSNHKYINIINSSTGEIVYLIHEMGVYNFKSKDLKEIQKKI